MTYEQALKRGERTGVGKADDEEFLALVCKSLAAIHAISPALVYEGAKKRRLTAKQVMKLGVDNPVGLGELMFV